jgi:hypothetical protein
MCMAGKSREQVFCGEAQEKGHTSADSAESDGVRQQADTARLERDAAATSRQEAEKVATAQPCMGLARSHSKNTGAPIV